MATRRKAGVREVHIALPDSSFEALVKILREVWVIPGPGGCSPCRSGLDRFIIEDPAFRGVMR